MKRKLFAIILGLLLLPALIFAQTITYEGSAVGAGTAQRSYGTHIVDWEIEPIGVTPISAATIMMQGSPTADGADNGAINSPGIAIGSTAERFANGAFTFRLSATNYSEVASAVGNTFSDNYLVSQSLYGAINVYINIAGTISTAVPASTQVYATALLAIAAADALTVPSSKIKIGMIVIQNDASLWTANTDDLTDASDVTLAAFYSFTSSFTEIDEYTLTADDITAQKGTFYLASTMPAAYVRIFLSSVTGEGNFVITDTLQR